MKPPTKFKSKKRGSDRDTFDILPIVVIAFVVIFVVVVSFKSLGEHDRGMELVIYANRLDAAIGGEITDTWRFLAGDESGVDEHKKLQQDILQIRSELEEKKGFRFERLLELVNYERDLNLSVFFYGEEGFFDSVRAAKKGFIGKNNKHKLRMSGYMSNWAESKSENEKKAFEVLEGIRTERILFEEFDPRSNEVDSRIADFRKANDDVVEGLVWLWYYEIDRGIEKISDQEMIMKLEGLKKVVSKINATSFPPISFEEAELLGIDYSESIRFDSDADASTKALYNSFKGYIEEYELNGGIPPWERGDVPKVGENVTPVFTIGKIVSCQQGLRINAEEWFRWQVDFVREVEPELILIKGNLDRLKDEISDNIKSVSFKIQILIVSQSLFVIFFMIFFVLHFTSNRDKI